MITDPLVLCADGHVIEIELMSDRPDWRACLVHVTDVDGDNFRRCVGIRGADLMVPRLIAAMDDPISMSDVGSDGAGGIAYWICTLGEPIHAMYWLDDFKTLMIQDCHGPRTLFRIAMNDYDRKLWRDKLTAWAKLL